MRGRKLHIGPQDDADSAGDFLPPDRPMSERALSFFLSLRVPSPNGILDRD